MRFWRRTSRPIKGTILYKFTGNLNSSIPIGYDDISPNVIQSGPEMGFLIGVGGYTRPIFG